MQELDQRQADDVSGGIAKRPPVTTMAVGEEGTTFTFSEDMTTLALGEEGCIPPRIPVISSAMGSF